VSASGLAAGGEPHPGEPDAAQRVRLLRAMYAAFNAREIERVLACMSPEVDWPNAWEGGRVRGHEAVRDYWRRQWSGIDPTVEPVAFATRPDGTIAVEVRQVVRGLDGMALSEGRVVHVYTFSEGLISRMDVE
jgi:ketosteroid isomerase-like protein